MVTRTPATNVDGSAGVDDIAPARIYLQPIAAPSILGLYGLAAATFMFGAFMANWFGTASATPVLLIPFAVIFGGFAQFLAGMWAYKARDGFATAMHGLWGSFWISYGLLYVLMLNGHATIPGGTTGQALGFWFIVLSVITAAGAFAATAESTGMAITFGVLTLASICLCLGNLLASTGLLALGGWLFFLTSLAAVYTASALMFEGSFGRSILPIGRSGRAVTEPGVSVGTGEPGVIHGQLSSAYVAPTATTAQRNRVA
jgi:uncharacterized protein